ncbi:MAG: amino acid adenylation domain-containing protein, partial [bacterium]|nr:amino acid adenylation domain-containing protein [bacterium]
KQETYWLKQFEDEIPVLDLPLDYPRPAILSFEGDSVKFTLSGDETKTLKTLALSGGATTFMVLLSVYITLLAKLGNPEDIIIGTPVAGRRHADLEKIIGMFVNTLALRNFPTGEKTFEEFLEEVKNRTLEAFENQEYQFETLVDSVSLNRDTGRNPLFDVLFAMQNEDSKSKTTGGTESGDTTANVLQPQNTPVGTLRTTSKFDLALNIVDQGENLVCTFQYRTKLFKKETILRFAGYFKTLVSLAHENEETAISDMEILTADEKQKMLHQFNDTAVQYPVGKTIHQLFREQVDRSPDSISVVSTQKPVSGNPITYRELDEKSNRLAALLKSKGVEPGVIVAIMLERSIEMIIGILGILKAGGAYLPIDPGHPEERINYMLADSNARILLVDDKSEIPISKQVNRAVGPVVLNLAHLDFEFVSDFEFRASGFPIEASGLLAYIIYTSGSTGKPKGVLVEHHSVLRLVKSTNYIEISKGDHLLLTGALVFDVTTFEIWGPLLNEAGLYLENKDDLLDAGKLETIVVKNKINILHLIPQLFNQMAPRNPRIFAGLKYVLVGGDLVRPGEVNCLRERYKDLEIRHMYGPTENTTFSTYFPVRRTYEHRIPIGKPVANSTVYIVDKYGNLNPLGVPGEILVGGDGVALGYLNQPELTAERFISAIGCSPEGVGGSENEPEKGAQSQLLRTAMQIKAFGGADGSYFPGISLYRTGDLGRWLADGSIEFLGRIDQQVKIRGIRVELGEIETQLVGHGGVKEAALLDHVDSNGEVYLCAYFVPPSPLTEETGTGGLIASLREYLALSLPAY